MTKVRPYFLQVTIVTYTQGLSWSQERLRKLGKVGLLIRLTCVRLMLV